VVRCWESKHGVRSRAAAHSPCGEIHPQSLTNKVCQVLGCSFRVTTAIHNFNSWIIPYNQTLQCPTAPMNRGIISYGPSCWGVGDSPPVTALQRAIKRAERSLSWVSCLLANIFTLRNLVIPRARTGDSLNDTHFPPNKAIGITLSRPLSATLAARVKKILNIGHHAYGSARCSSSNPFGS